MKKPGSGGTSNRRPTKPQTCRPKECQYPEKIYGTKFFFPRKFRRGLRIILQLVLVGWSDFLKKEKPRQHQREPPVPDHSTQGKSSSTETRKAVESESIPARLHILRTPCPGGPLEDMETLIPLKEKKTATFSAEKSTYYLTSRAIEMLGLLRKVLDGCNTSHDSDQRENH